MTDTATDLGGVGLADLGAAVEWTDAEVALRARTAAKPGGGLLTDLAEWLAGAQAQCPPLLPRRPRCVIVGAVSEVVRVIAVGVGVGVRDVEPFEGESIGAALQGGVDAADDEIESGADLLVVAAPGRSDAAAVLVGLLTGAEPVALLPRGADATDTAGWIERAETLRDTRRRVAGLRSDPDDLLAALGDQTLAATVGLVMRTAARRTPLVLDGTVAVAAALLCHDVQSRAGRWWRFADACPDPVHARVAQELGQRPLLHLGTSEGDGTAGLLTLPLLSAAVELAGRP